MTAKNIDRRINQIELMSRALAGMRMADEVPTMPREVIAYLAPFAHLSGEHDAVSFLVEAMQAEWDEDWISVRERLPELQNDMIRGSVDVEAKDAEGNFYPCAWCVVDKDDDYYGNWIRARRGQRFGEHLLFGITHWRPMRGDHD